MAAHIQELIGQLPPGRARERYQKLAEKLGDTMAVRWSDAEQPLWVVPDSMAASVMASLGLPRWRVWTLGEIQALLGCFGESVDTVEEAAAALQVCRHVED
jgi:hypothetical protein